MFVLPPSRMLATGVADLDQQVIDWMGRAPEGSTRYIAEPEDGVDLEGNAILICRFFVLVGSELAELCSARSVVDWPDAVRNCLGIALTLEPPSLDVVVGIASLKALEALAIAKGLKS